MGTTVTSKNIAIPHQWVGLPIIVLGWGVKSGMGNVLTDRRPFSWILKDKKDFSG